MIKKFQSGGSANFFADYKPFTTATTPATGDSGTIGTNPFSVSSSTSSSKKSSSGSSTGSVTEKDLMNMVKQIDGLPSDMDVVLNKISRLTTISNIYLLPGQASTSSLSSTYLLALGEVKKATWNKKQYDNAYKIAQQKDSLSEVAITPDGRVFAQDKDGKMQTVTVDQYAKGGYTPLTNSNLLYLRAHDEKFADANEIFETVENGIGMEAVTKLIQEGASKLGSDETERQGYSSIDAKKGLKLLVEVAKRDDVNVDDLMSVDGLYKAKVFTKTQANQAQKAIEYIWQMLPQNAKTLLSLKSGNTENPTAGGLGLVTKMITSQTSSVFKFTPELQKDLNSDGSKKQTIKAKVTADPNKNIKLNDAQRFQEGYGEKVQLRITNGTQAGLDVTCTRVSTGQANQSLNDLSGTNFGQILDFQNVSANGVHISNANLSQVLTDGQIYKMELPYTKDENGNIKPNMELLKAVDEADKECKQNNITDPEKINQVYQSKGLPVKYQNGNLITDNYMTFAGFNATALGTAFPEDPTFDLEEMTDKNEIEGMLQHFRKSMGYNEANSGKNKLKFDTISSWDKMSPIFNGHDSMYKTTVFIPMTVNAFNGMTGTVNPTDALRIEALEQQRQTLSNYNKPQSISY